jgi:hypothetical protein
VRADRRDLYLSLATCYYYFYLTFYSGTCSPGAHACCPTTTHVDMNINREWGRVNPKYPEVGRGLHEPRDLLFELFTTYLALAFSGRIGSRFMLIYLYGFGFCRFFHCLLLLCECFTSDTLSRFKNFDPRQRFEQQP